MIRRAVQFYALPAIALTAVAVCLIAEDKPADLARRKRFDSQIAPLLAKRCLDCHNSTDKKGGLDLSSRRAAVTGGESGPAVDLKNPDDSLLWERVSAGEMPPKKPLSAGEKQLLKSWLAAGANWGTDPINRYRFSTDNRAGYDWWALKPLERPRIPKLKTRPQPKNAIDAFIRAKLEEKKLSPSPPADKRTLIRRLYFDLLGLPPTPEEIDAFLADKSPDAYAKLVDRMLRSPHYGERWARHWLDVVRFGESQGFERDKLRENSWQYRDWVVAALNSDMPYDEFARLQIAGDVLRPGDSAAITATGFIVAGPYDEVGQSQQSAAMRAVVRQDELEDIVSSVGQTFLGLTVNCARCHDHKFDPVTQKEYYQLTAALGGIRHGERTIPADEERLTSVETKIEELASALQKIDVPIRKRILADRKTKNPAKPNVPQPFARWDFDADLKDSVGKLHGTIEGKARLDNGALVVDGKSAYVATAALTKELKAKTLEVWVSLENLAQRGGGAISIQTLDGGVFDAIVFGEREPKRWMAGSNGFVRTQSFGGSGENEVQTKPVHVAIVYAADGTITGYRHGQAYGKPYKSNGPITFAPGKAQVIFGLRHGSAGGNRLLSGAIHKAQLYDRALSSDEVAASAGVVSDYVSDALIAAQLDTPTRNRRKQLKDRLSRLQMEFRNLQNSKVYAVAPRKPETAHLLQRGNPKQQGEVVSAGGIKALSGLNADFGLAADAPDAQRRIKLAQWITNSRNPLFARVIVNRLWHYHFGIGLVDTPSDFGFNGGRPTHPELIDWLAAELIRGDWSLKAVHRQIVLSAAYRQSSRFDQAAAKLDAGNRLLWRKSPRRLEAEAVRDTVLSVAGQLNPQRGGRGYRDFRTFNRNSQFYEMLDPIGPKFNRRSLYRTWVRSGRSRFLDVFDCPDPSTKTPKRAVTTTPLQALALMNNSFVLRMSDRFADRIRKQAGSGRKQQIARAYRLAFGRAPQEDELQLTVPFVEQHGLSAFCRVMFNSNEFLYVD